jgi:CBS domain-containing protein
MFPSSLTRFVPSSVEKEVAKMAEGRNTEKRRLDPALDLDRPDLRPLAERYTSLEEGIRTWPLLGVSREATLQDAATMMADRGVSLAGVFGQSHQLLGIVTERDLTWAVAQGKDASRTPVMDVVNDFPVILDVPISRSKVIDAMNRSHIRHVIIREGAGEFRIVSIRDLIRPELGDPHGRAEPSAPASGDLARIPVRRCMTTPVAVCYENDDLETVAGLLTDREVSGLPVLSAAGKVIGVVSEADVARALGAPLLRMALRPQHSGPFLREGPSPAPHTAADVMSTPPIVVHPETPVHTVAEIMIKKNVNRLPVVLDDKLLGVVSRGDILAEVAAAVAQAQ